MDASTIGRQLAEATKDAMPRLKAASIHLGWVHNVNKDGTIDINRGALDKPELLLGVRATVACSGVKAGSRVLYEEMNHRCYAVGMLTEGDWSSSITGPQGPMGPQGPKGETGPQGPKGDAGAQGPMGPTGPVGPDGAAGRDGERGPSGAQGERGPAGPSGPQGAVGAVGPQGPSGPRGDPGPAGPSGPMGESGPVGPQGPMGPQGPKGERGDRGPAGESGAYAPADGFVYFSVDPAGNLYVDTPGDNPATAWSLEGGEICLTIGE